MLGVVAKLTVKPGQFEKFWKYLEADATGSRAEPGCLRFDVLRDSASPHVIHLYEVYRDRLAFAAHQEAPYFKAFFAEAGDTLAEAPVVHMTEVVSPTAEAYWSKRPA